MPWVKEKILADSRLSDADQRRFYIMDSTTISHVCGMFIKAIPKIDRIEQLVGGNLPLYPTPPVVEALAHMYYIQITNICAYPLNQILEGIQKKGGTKVIEKVSGNR